MTSFVAHGFQMLGPGTGGQWHTDPPLPLDLHGIHMVGHCVKTVTQKVPRVSLNLS